MSTTLSDSKVVTIINLLTAALAEEGVICYVQQTEKAIAIARAQEEVIEAARSLADYRSWESEKALNDALRKLDEVKRG